MQMTTANSSAPVWFITGASGGFGRAVSRAVLQRGEPVAATSRDRAVLEALVAEFPRCALALGLEAAEADLAPGTKATPEARP